MSSVFQGNRKSTFQDKSHHANRFLKRTAPKKRINKALSRTLNVGSKYSRDEIIRKLSELQSSKPPQASIILSNQLPEKIDKINFRFKASKGEIDVKIKFVGESSYRKIRNSGDNRQEEFYRSPAERFDFEANLRRCSYTFGFKISGATEIDKFREFIEIFRGKSESLQERLDILAQACFPHKSSQ